MIKQMFTFSISFMVFIFIFIPTTHADEGKMYEVGTEVLELKNAPAQEAEAIGLLVRGDRVTIFQEKFGWVQTFYGGKKVWVASQYLIPISEEKPSDTSEQVPNDELKEESKENIKSDKNDNDNQANSESVNDELNKVESPDVKSASIEISSNINNNRSLSDYHFVIDPGHGGNDSGAINDGVFEKELTLTTAKLVAEKLQAEGATVTLTRSDDTYISLDKRVQTSNENEIDAFISLHYNAFSDPSAKGINTFYYTGEEGLKLAQTIQDSLISYVNLNNRGAKQANYYVLRENNNLAILVELGFITNPKELEIIRTPEYREKVSEGITDGLKSYFGK